MTGDKLDRIFAMQKSLNDDIVARRGLEGISDGEWIQKYMLAMLSEMAETLDETNWKWWKNPKPVSHDALCEELVDVLHFYVSMCLRAGMDGEELFKRYCAKNEENFRRQDGVSDKKGYEAPKPETGL